MGGKPTVYEGTSVPASSHIQYWWKATHLCSFVDNTQKVCSKELTHLVQQQQHSCSQKNMCLPYTPKLLDNKCGRRHIFYNVSCFRANDFPTTISSNNTNSNSKSHNFQLPNSTRIKHHYVRQYHPNNIRI